VAVVMAVVVVAGVLERATASPAAVVAVTTAASTGGGCGERQLRWQSWGLWFAVSLVQGSFEYWFSK